MDIWMYSLPWSVIYLTVALVFVIATVVRAIMTDRSTVGLGAIFQRFTPLVVAIVASFGAFFASVRYNDVPVGVHVLIILLLLGNAVPLFALPRKVRERLDKRRQQQSTTP